MTERKEENLVMRVDQNPAAHQPTEGDEEEVLEELYGEPDELGYYTGGETS
jgi:hypothetical protein